MSLGVLSVSDAERFWAKVDARGPDDCWPWKAGRLRQGYGVFSIQGKSLKAHRVALAFSGVVFPEHMLVCHHCDNPPCCNPAHLFVGTPLDNMRDKIAKGRHRGAHAGEGHHGARLTENDVRAIRSSGKPHRELASQYGVAVGTIAHIIHRERWRHVA